MKKIQVSVIIPVYNAEKYLRQCLDTVVNQTLKDIEIILIDDESTDNSLSICQEYAKRDQRIQIYTQKNCGAGATRNRGIKLAMGKYLSFLDADDFFELNMLKLLYREAETTNADITFCDFYKFDDILKCDMDFPNSIRSNLIPHKHPFSPQDCSDAIFQLIGTGAAWTSLYNRAFVLKNNIKFATQMRGEDACFTKPALITAKRISWVNKKLLHYRTNLASALSSRCEKYQYAVFDRCLYLYNYLTERKLFHLFKRSFFENVVSSSLHYEIYRLRYPLRFFSEARFINKIINKYQINNFKKEYFYDLSLFNKIRTCIQSAKKSILLRKQYKEQKDKIVPIVFKIQEEEALRCGVAIQSIIEHVSDDHFYDIYVLHMNLSENMKYKLENMTKKNVNITMIDIKNIKFPYQQIFSDIIKNAYDYLFLPSILSYKKVLWLDHDIIVQKDISQLYATELDNDLLAGVADINKNEEKRNDENREANVQINPAVLLINNELWEKENIQEKCMNTITHGSHTLNKSDIINFIGQGRSLFLNPKWNFLYETFYCKKEEYSSNVNSAHIIRYNSKNEPYLHLEEENAEFWWNYARKSPFYEVLLYKIAIQNKRKQLC